MPSFNKTIIAGHLGADPELRYLPSNTPVVSFSIATKEKWTDKQSGEKQERTTWIDCEAFARAAEVLNQYLRKGSAVLLEGKLRQDRWEDQQGNKRSKLKLIVNEFQFLGDPRGDDGQQRQQQRPSQQSTPPQQPATQGGPALEPDDVPFHHEAPRDI